MITLNVYGLNAPIKRHRIAEWIRKHDPHICCLQESHLRTKDLHRLKMKDFKKDIDSNTIIVMYFNTLLSKIDRPSK